MSDITLLLFHVDTTKTSVKEVQELLIELGKSRLGHRSDLHPIDNVDDPSGPHIGVFRSNSAAARQRLEAHPGITVLPPLHRPIKEHHAAVFAHVDAQAGEFGSEIAERLHDLHGLHWLHPENLWV